MLDMSNVMMIFKQLSGCPESVVNSELPTVHTAVFKLKAMLDFDKIKPCDIPSCEYAAACCAVYDYVCKEACKEKLITNAEGKASMKEDLTHRIPAAHELKLSALEAIRGLTASTDFLFEAI